MKMGFLDDAAKAIKEKYSEAVVKKEGSQYCIFSKSGKKLECFPTKKEASDRLRQIEFFKNKDK